MRIVLLSVIIFGALYVNGLIINFIFFEVWLIELDIIKVVVYCFVFVNFLRRKLLFVI